MSLDKETQHKTHKKKLRVIKKAKGEESNDIG